MEGSLHFKSGSLLLRLGVKSLSEYYTFYSLGSEGSYRDNVTPH
jgi:hypothetical protein